MTKIPFFSNSGNGHRVPLYNRVQQKAWITEATDSPCLCQAVPNQVTLVYAAY